MNKHSYLQYASRTGRYRRNCMTKPFLEKIMNTKAKDVVFEVLCFLLSLKVFFQKLIGRNLAGLLLSLLFFSEQFQLVNG